MWLLPDITFTIWKPEERLWHHKAAKPNMWKAIFFQFHPRPFRQFSVKQVGQVHLLINQSIALCYWGTQTLRSFYLYKVLTTVSGRYEGLFWLLTLLWTDTCRAFSQWKSINLNNCSMQSTILLAECYKKGN